MPKSKQLVQRFNRAFRRNKVTTVVSSLDRSKSLSQPEISAEGAKVPESQHRAGWEGRTGPGQHQVQKASRAEGTNTASRAGQVLDCPQGGPATQQKAYMQGARTDDRAEAGSIPGATPKQPLKLRTFSQQPYSVPAPSFSLQCSPSPSQSPFSQLGSSSQPLLPSSSASLGAKAEAQDRPSLTPKQAMRGRNGSSWYCPDPEFEIQPSPDQLSASLQIHNQDRALCTQQAAPAVRAEANSPATWSSTHVLPAVPTPDREEELKERAPRSPNPLDWPASKSFEAVPEQQYAGYIPGIYDDLASATSASTTAARLPQQQQQQQQRIFQSQDQQWWPQWQQQQMQQPLSRGNSRDYMVDLQALNSVPESSRQTPMQAQRAQRDLDRSSDGPGQASPPVAQQVPFYESSPEYMPTTLAIKTPVSTRVISYFTGLLGTHKKPTDVETGMRPTSSSPPAAQESQEPSQPAGSSPKTALFRSGIFQNPRAADQDRPMSPEQAERRARGLVRTRVEPKVFFANERTFLQWLQISVLLMFTGLSLLGGSSVSSLGGSGEATATCDSTACKASKVDSHYQHACCYFYTKFVLELVAESMTLWLYDIVAAVEQVDTQYLLLVVMTQDGVEIMTSSGTHHDFCFGCLSLSRGFLSLAASI